MKTVSWILLTIAMVLVMLGGFASVLIAYYAPDSNDQIIESATLAEIGVSEEVATALRGRRATAGAYALAFGFVLLMVVIGPYRKGEVWAWWAILLPAFVLALILLLRIPALGLYQGATTGLYFFAVVAIALALDSRRLTSGPESA